MGLIECQAGRPLGSTLRLAWHGVDREDRLPRVLLPQGIRPQCACFFLGKHAQLLPPGDGVFIDSLQPKSLMENDLCLVFGLELRSGPVGAGWSWAVHFGR